jgi:hypothetical protein
MVMDQETREAVVIAFFTGTLLVVWATTQTARQAKRAYRAFGWGDNPASRRVVVAKWIAALAWAMNAAGWIFMIYFRQVAFGVGGLLGGLVLKLIAEHIEYHAYDELAGSPLD